MTEKYEVLLGSSKVRVDATDELRRDKYGYVDWKSHGWPEPNPYGAGDTSTMPYEVWGEWVAMCEIAEEIWERGDDE